MKIFLRRGMKAILGERLKYITSLLYWTRTIDNTHDQFKITSTGLKTSSCTNHVVFPTFRANRISQRVNHVVKNGSGRSP